LAENADVYQHEALKGQFSGRYRIRSGHYRVIYRLEREERRIVIEKIGHRSDVYEE
jgi:mRNA interferase RelE/StbE